MSNDLDKTLALLKEIPLGLGYEERMIWRREEAIRRGLIKEPEEKNEPFYEAIR